MFPGTLLSLEAAESEEWDDDFTSGFDDGSLSRSQSSRPSGERGLALATEDSRLFTGVNRLERVPSSVDSSTDVDMQEAPFSEVDSLMDLKAQEPSLPPRGASSGSRRGRLAKYEALGVTPVPPLRPPPPPPPLPGMQPERPEPPSRGRMTSVKSKPALVPSPPPSTSVFGNSGSSKRRSKKTHK